MKNTIINNFLAERLSQTINAETWCAVGMSFPSSPFS